MANEDFGELLMKSSRKKSKNAPRLPEVDDDDITIDSHDTKSNNIKNGIGLQTKPSKKGGWGTDSPSATKKNRKDGTMDFEDDRLRPGMPQEEDGNESDTDIPVIPELESETQKVRSDGHVAMAPHVAVNRVATYKELDSELLKHSTFLTLENDINLKLLAKGLSSESDLIEDDVTWQWDQLFADVTSELLTEWENEEQGQTEKTMS